MQKKTVFLLQDTKETIKTIEEHFSKSKEFEIIGSDTDAISALSLLADRKPTFLITEMVLSGYDGFSVIEKVKAMDKNVKIIVLTACCSDDVIYRAMTLGADFYLAKPINFEVLEARMNDVINGVKPDERSSNLKAFHNVSLEEKISKIFINVGIPPHIKGYVFLREGVKMAVEEPNIINNITKRLYPSIGDKFGTSASKVERAIRHAIEVAWNRGRIEAINSILGVRAYVGQDKPTNGEFIALVADKMLLELE